MARSKAEVAHIAIEALKPGLDAVLQLNGFQAGLVDKFVSGEASQSEVGPYIRQREISPKLLEKLQKSGLTQDELDKHGFIVKGRDIDGKDIPRLDVTGLIEAAKDYKASVIVRIS